MTKILDIHHKPSMQTGHRDMVSAMLQFGTSDSAANLKKQLLPLTMVDKLAFGRRVYSRLGSPQTRANVTYRATSLPQRSVAERFPVGAKLDGDVDCYKADRVPLEATATTRRSDQ